METKIAAINSILALLGNGQTYEKLATLMKENGYSKW